MAATLICLAVPRFLAGLAIAEHEPTLRQVQRGRSVGLGELIAARRGYETALSWHAGLEERSALAALLLRMALELDPRSMAGRAMLDATREAAHGALLERPANPYLWAQLAETELLSQGSGPAFAAALARSIALAPNEPSLIPFRARLGLGAWVSLDGSAREAVAGQVVRAARFTPDVLRKFATEPLRRRLVGELLAERPELYARVFAEAAR